MADAPAPVRIPARRHYRVQLRFVTEEQLFAAGPLSLPNPKSLRLEVHPAGEAADATVTDGEVLARPTHASRARKWRTLARAWEGGAGCGPRAPEQVCAPSARLLAGAGEVRGYLACAEEAQMDLIVSDCAQRNFGARGRQALRTSLGHNL